MSEIEGDGVTEFNFEDLEDDEKDALQRAVVTGRGKVSLYAYVYIDIERAGGCYG